MMKNCTSNKPTQGTKRKRSSWVLWIFPFSGLIALIWFLIRVIPKPSRVAYPCQRIAFPLASGFIVWLTGILGSLVFIRRATRNIAKTRYQVAAVCIAISVICLWLTISVTTNQTAIADNPVPNDPIGIAKGVCPGRVVWVYAPDATNWDGLTGYWCDEFNTNQSVVEAMMSSAIHHLADVSNDANDMAAWDVIFKNFNQSQGKGEIGYQGGEKITIKVNLVTSNYTVESVDPDYNQVQDLEYVNTSPNMIVALLDQLVNGVGVSQEDIWIGDTTSYFPNHYWNICHAAFPMVHYFDCAGEFGRELAVPSNIRIYWSTFAADGYNYDYVPLCYAQAEYIINFACLKTSAVGVTLCAKNHYGSLCRIPVESGYYNLHEDLSWDPGVPGMGHYRTLVDLFGHSQIGNKTLLNLIDGLWGGYGSLRVVPPQKWNMAPFNGDWPSSLFVSQDPVAIDSVGYDFLWAEDDASTDMFPYSTYHYAKVSGGEDYLHEAAQANMPPSETFYDPDGGGGGIASLGVHEHWNNPIDKLYSRNLETGNGIELIGVVISYCKSDFNTDGDVNLADFAIFAAAWQSESGDAIYNPNCDISDPIDGIINEADLAVFADEWLITPCQ